MRITGGDGFSKILTTVYDAAALFLNIDIAPAAEALSTDYFVIATRLDPTLILEWTKGTSADFSVYLRLYNDWPHLSTTTLTDVPVALHLDATTDNGAAVAVRSVGSVVNMIYPIARFVIKNEDPNQGALHIVSSMLVQVKQ